MSKLEKHYRACKRAEKRNERKFFSIFHKHERVERIIPVNYLEAN